MARVLNITLIDTPNLYTDFKTQFTRVRFTLFVSGALALVSVLGVYTISVLGRIPLADLTRDPAAINNTQFYYGLLTYVNIVLWAAATAICLLGAILIGSNPDYRRIRLFLLFGSVLNLLLLTDDALLLHEVVFPQMFGIKEKFVMGAYLLFTGAYLFAYLPEIRRSDYMLLLLAIGGLGISVVIDKILSMSDFVTFIEDSFKLFGIVFWTVYFARYVVNIVQSRFVR
ncbi:MAG: hypothetical protein H7X77_10305 [Anaerolineae bacterium]|nr:hypothetical protein [Anaerolineae bacterium]